MGGTPVTSVLGTNPEMALAMLTPIQISVDGVSVLFALEADAASVRLFVMPAFAVLTGVLRIHQLNPNACYLYLVANHLLQLIKRPGMQVPSGFFL
jgi:hypothetical protein